VSDVDDDSEFGEIQRLVSDVVVVTVDVVGCYCFC
jgi:hypothetical protein